MLVLLLDFMCFVLFNEWENFIVEGDCSSRIGVWLFEDGFDVVELGVVVGNWVVW